VKDLIEATRAAFQNEFWVAWTVSWSRYASQKKFRGWSGLVPASSQSGSAEKKGLRITHAGPDPIKKYAYIIAERYHVPEEVRKRNNQQARKARRDEQAERKRKRRRSRPGR